MPQAESCPSELEILLWVSGQVADDRGRAIGSHVASCVPCGENLHAAEWAVTAVAEAVAEELPDDLSPAEKEALDAISAAAKRHDQEVARIFAEQPMRWASLVTTHPDRGDCGFLYRIADRTVYDADEKPAEVLIFAAALRPVVDELPTQEPDRGRIHALLHLAEGWALRTQGDHLAALECYARAERALPEPALELEFPRINLARGASLRRLNRHDEARVALELARQGFARCGLVGEAKALWQLGNLAWEAGDHRAAIVMGSRAHRILLREGNTREAALALWTVVAPLLALRRPSPARRILTRLEQEPVIRENPYERARLRWNQGMLAALEHDGPRSCAFLEEAATMFAQAGATLDAARVMMDHAYVAGQRGELRDQTRAAAQAVAILEKLPGQGAEWATALAELQDALRVEAALSQVIATIRERLRRA